MVTMATSTVKGWHSYPPQQESNAQSTGRSSARHSVFNAAHRQAIRYARQIVVAEDREDWELAHAVGLAWKAFLRQFAGTSHHDSLRVAYWGAYMDW